ncbi:MarR family transcriptional regulator (plasmid) [Fusobacteria bacterium ZRK30]|nr:MarR family transcriptional regulator [Fusobacteria bacterium ZRK30]
MIHESCVLSIMKFITYQFDETVKAELNKRNIPIEGKHAELFMILFAYDNKMEFKKLTKAWRKSKSSLSDVVNKYEKSGLLRRVSSDSDKRIITVEATNEALKYIPDFDNISKNYLNKAVKGTSLEEIKILKKIILDMKYNLI